MKKLVWVPILLLSACAPVVGNPARVEVTSPRERLSYYPFEAGLINTYLEDGERVDAPTLKRENLGPTFIGGETYQQVRLYGRSADELHYFVVKEDGVLLAREERGETVITYDPPIRVFPAALEVGASWSGETVATIASASGVQPKAQISYRYAVVERRPVSVRLEKLVLETEAFVIVEEQRFSEPGGAPRTSTLSFWFTPHLGEVRTRSGAYLIGSNF